LLQLPDKVQKLIESRLLNMGHARPLVGLPAVIAETLAGQCVASGWSARQMEAHAKKAQGAIMHPSVSNVVDAEVAALQNELTRSLGLVVEICCRKNGSGEMRIKYSKPAELDGVLARLRA